MANRTHKKRPRDPNQLGKMIVDISVGDIDDHYVPSPEEQGKHPGAVALGRLGGLKGGKARAKKLTAKERKAIAKKAASIRWAARSR